MIRSLKPRPFGRTRYLTALVGALQLPRPSKQLTTAADRGALPRGSRGDLLLPRAALPVLVGFAARHLANPPFDADLPAGLVPIEGDRGSWVVAQLAAFAAERVGEKDEAGIADALDENVADRRTPGRIGGGQSHGIRSGNAGTLGRGQPAPALPDRIDAHGSVKRP